MILDFSIDRKQLTQNLVSGPSEAFFGDRHIFFEKTWKFVIKQ